MAQISHGEVSVVIPDDLPIPAEAGKLSGAQVRAIPKPRRGIGAAAADTADAMRKLISLSSSAAGPALEGLRKDGEAWTAGHRRMHDGIVVKPLPLSAAAPNAVGRSR